jgi:hypothetical protein
LWCSHRDDALAFALRLAGSGRKTEPNSRSDIAQSGELPGYAAFAHPD